MIEQTDTANSILTGSVKRHKLSVTLEMLTDRETKKNQLAFNATVTFSFGLLSQFRWH